MNNEPVAWMHHCLKSGIGYLSYTKPPPLDDYKPIPLYTHPVKELTDEEIQKIALAELGTEHDWQNIAFARAILRLDEVAGNNTKEVIEALNKTIRQQQAEIDRLNYDMEGFKQNFFVSGFHLQIKMANEQLVKQQELTDEEIYDVFEGCLFKGGFNKYEFARAILRKAQEK